MLAAESNVLTTRPAPCATNDRLPMIRLLCNEIGENYENALQVNYTIFDLLCYIEFLICIECVDVYLCCVFVLLAYFIMMFLPIL